MSVASWVAIEKSSQSKALDMLVTEEVSLSSGVLPLCSGYSVGNEGVVEGGRSRAGPVEGLIMLLETEDCGSTCDIKCAFEERCPSL